MDLIISDYRMLRVLQEREFERVGGARPLRVDVRIIATTNRDLASYAAQGHFRQDLFLRLSVIPVSIPPLRERPDEIVPLARALGAAGKVNGGVYQVSVPRHEEITMDGEVILPSMGVSTAINFQSTGRGWAAITGDFVLLSDEVNRIIPILRDNQIAITALHSHMLGEEPRLYFMHFWADGDVTKLAPALRSALDQTK